MCLLTDRTIFYERSVKEHNSVFINWQHICLEGLITAIHFSAFCWQGIGQSHNSMNTVICVVSIYQNYKCIYPVIQIDFFSHT